MPSVSELLAWKEAARICIKRTPIRSGELRVLLAGYCALTRQQIYEWAVAPTEEQALEKLAAQLASVLSDERVQRVLRAAGQS